MARANIRIPMPIKMRAKQFAMFDALKGLTEAIAEKEQYVCLKRELTEERIEELNQAISVLQKGKRVKLRYFCQYGKEHCEVTGLVAKIDLFWNEIQIGNERIEFCEIEDIQILD